ncbi:MAG: SDR family oxidoreductase [Gammaproteobacteria bacterium]|nr:SDR family oxidoreductase [Gammaproteobacteria bacterium]MDP2141998.1 SDR family oxidoreductase [Gammaproteobacteria bacterium]MDP2348423.1 SDR family oxidoreductase [Gammaproteobacteria bacterium]
MKNILVVGANSAIAKSVSRLYAEEHCRLYLLARNEEELALQKQDLLIRGASEVDYSVFDVNNFSLHDAIVDQVLDSLGSIDLAILCHGSLPDQALCAENFDAALKEFNTNALSVISLLTSLANHMSIQRCGCIAVITSVAGDRGRQSNYIYGAAKGMVSLYLQGLRGRLHPSGIHVVDIRPGFVDTPMTHTFKKGALWASPEQVAECIVNGIRKKKHTIYAPWFWRVIMMIVCSVPEVIFKRLKF